MVSSDDEDSLYNNMPSHSIKIPTETDIISTTTTDQFEDCATNEYSESRDGIVAAALPLLDLYFNDTSIMPAIERTQSLLAACFGSVPDFSLEN